MIWKKSDDCFTLRRLEPSKIFTLSIQSTSTGARERIRFRHCHVFWSQFLRPFCRTRRWQVLTNSKHRIGIHHRNRLGRSGFICNASQARSLDSSRPTSCSAHTAVPITGLQTPTANAAANGCPRCFFIKAALARLPAIANDFEAKADRRLDNALATAGLLANWPPIMAGATHCG